MSDATVGQDVRAQAASVDEAAQDPLGREAFQVGARFTETLAQAFHVTDSKPPSDQRVEVDATRDEVAACLDVDQFASIGKREVVEGLDFDQGES